MNGILLNGLNSRDYEHPLDRKALSALEKTPGLPTIVKRFNQFWSDKIIKIQYTGSNIKVNERNFPQLHEMLLEACKILDIIKIPDLYIIRSMDINAFTCGVEDPAIVLNSGSVDYMNYDELLFIIGHELGHIKSQHVLYQQMTRELPALGKLIGDFTLNIGSILASGVQIALLNWQRMSEFTADRAGLLTCQDSNAAASAMMKIAGVPNRFFNNINMEEFVRQAKEFEEYDEDTMDKMIKVMSITGQSHPWTVMRASEFYKWTENGEYNNIISKYSSGTYYQIEDEKTVVCCDKCFSKMKVPRGKGSILVKCTYCSSEFRVTT